MLLPSGQLIRLDGEAQVEVALAMMGGDSAARRRCGLLCATFLEQQQHLPSWHAHDAEAVICQEFVEPEDACVEITRPPKVGDVKRCFQNMVDSRWGSHREPPALDRNRHETRR